MICQVVCNNNDVSPPRLPPIAHSLYTPRREVSLRWDLACHKLRDADDKDNDDVTHALRWIAPRGDSQTTHAIVLTDSVSLLQRVKSGMGSPDWNVSTSTFVKSCGCTALDIPE